MQATDEIDIYNFEGNLERDIETYLEANGLNVSRSLDGDKLPDSYVSAKVDISGLASDQYQTKPDGSIEFSHYAATLTIRVRTRRNGEPRPAQSYMRTTHEANRGKVRKLISRSSTAIQDYLGYYEILQLRPAATETDTEEDRLDVSEIGFEFVFTINPSAWPDA